MKRRPPEEGVLIEYAALGTMSVDEFRRALWTDLEILKDQYNVKYVKEPRLTVPITDEFGEFLKLRRPGGKRVDRLRTYHFRPVCTDYEP